MLRERPSTPREAAHFLFERGITPIPIPTGQKGPRRKGWQTLQVTEGDIARLFTEANQNVGGLNDGQVHGVDLDCAEAVRAAPYFLPQTGLVGGRRARPTTHFWYRLREPVRTLRFDDPASGEREEKRRLLELLGTGTQIVVFGQHPSGDSYALEQLGEPCLLAASELVRAVRELAACTLLARHWPGEGVRQDYALALAGMLLRGGVPDGVARQLLDRSARVAGDEEAARRAETVTQTAAKLAAGEETTGFTRAATFVDPRVLRQVSTWLGVQRVAATGERLDSLPTVDINDEKASGIMPAIWRAFEERNEPPRLFSYAGGIARVDQDADGIVRLTTLSLPEMAHETWRTVNLVRGGGDLGPPRSVHPPQWLVADLLAEPEPPLPALGGLVEIPTFAADGALETAPGYHSASRTYYCPPRLAQPIPPVPERPGAAAIAAARALLLEELLCDFPFTAPSDRANAIGLYLAPFARSLIAGPTPLHAIEAATPGTGKGLLVDILLGPALGRHIGLLAPVRDEDEMRKRLTAALLGGNPAIVLDNVRTLTSSVLCAALTADTWEDRRLGVSQTVRLPIHTIWVATGNNVTYSTEVARRTVRIRLTPDRDRPWLRPMETFRHPDLRRWVMEGRDACIWAGLVLVQAWLAAGRPAGPRTLGSFVEWAETIGGILAVAGVDGFLDNALEFYEQADNEGDAWRAFVGAWWEQYQDRPIGVADLLVVAEPIAGIDLGKSESPRARATSLGMQIQKQRERIFDGYRITFAGTAQRLKRWALLPVIAREEH